MNERGQSKCQFCKQLHFEEPTSQAWIFQLLRLIRSTEAWNIHTFAAIMHERYYYPRRLSPPCLSLSRSPSDSPSLSLAPPVRRCFVSGIKPANIHPTVRDFGACLAPAIEPCSLCPAFRVNSTRISPPPPDSSVVSSSALRLFLPQVVAHPDIYFVPPSS